MQADGVEENGRRREGCREDEQDGAALVGRPRGTRAGSLDEEGMGRANMMEHRLNRGSLKGRREEGRRRRQATSAVKRMLGCHEPRNRGTRASDSLRVDRDQPRADETRVRQDRGNSGRSRPSRTIGSRVTGGSASLLPLRFFASFLLPTPTHHGPTHVQRRQGHQQPARQALEPVQHRPRSPGREFAARTLPSPFSPTVNDR